MKLGNCGNSATVSANYLLEWRNLIQNTKISNRNTNINPIPYRNPNANHR